MGDAADKQFEFLAGTLPRSPASNFPVRFHAANSAWKLSSVVSDIKYKVETSSDITDCITLQSVNFIAQ